MEYQDYIFNIIDIFIYSYLSKMYIQTTNMSTTYKDSQWRYLRGFLCYVLDLVKLLIQSISRAVSKV